MQKISSKQIKTVILEQARVLKRKQQIFEEVLKLESELKTINESFTTGSFGFAIDGDKAKITKTGFAAPQNISHIAKLAKELGETNEDNEETPKV